jgi:hypothetical protein
VGATKSWEISEQCSAGPPTWVYEGLTRVGRGFHKVESAWQVVSVLLVVRGTMTRLGGAFQVGCFHTGVQECVCLACPSQEEDDFFYPVVIMPGVCQVLGTQ